MSFSLWFKLEKALIFSWSARSTSTSSSASFGSYCEEETGRMWSTNMKTRSHREDPRYESS